MSTFDLYNYFSGKWQLRRKISGFTLIHGKAAFTPFDNQTLHYRENTQLIKTNTNPIHAFRELVYKVENGNLYVYFSDIDPNEGLFHEIKIHSLEKSLECGKYHCGKDTYTCTYDFIDKNHFKLIYDVCGPNKSYQSITDFIRKL